MLLLQRHGRWLQRHTRPASNGLGEGICYAGETQPMEASSSEEYRLSDAEVQKVEEVAFRTAAAEASGNMQEARVIKDAAQPTPRQVRHCPPPPPPPPLFPFSRVLTQALFLCFHDSSSCDYLPAAF